jgi:hypothetical protein
MKLDRKINEKDLVIFYYLVPVLDAIKTFPSNPQNKHFLG